MPLPGSDDESNPCNLATGRSFSSVGHTPIGSMCTDFRECEGASLDSATTSVICSADGGASHGTCTSGRVAVALGLKVNLTAQVGGAGGVPPCPPLPGGCGGFVGNPAACQGGEDGDTCVAQRARKQCLYNTAVAEGQCPGGVILPVPLGANWTCTEGQGAAQQKFCGPAGQWYCKCPNEPMPPLWQEQLAQCGPKCGDKARDAGEACDDGNVVDGDGCSAKCEVEPGQQCNLPNRCANNGAPVCAQNEICEPIDQLPCIKCTPVIGGQCTGRECIEGGDAAAAAQGMECSLIPNLPCITFIPPNSCGNGEINVVPPQEVDEGCEVTGTAGQYCMPEGVRPDDFGIFLPIHRCFASAHCKNDGGRCAWEMTADLMQCIEEQGGPQPVVVARNLDADPFMAQVVDPLDDGGMIPRACMADVRSCCENGVIIVKGRDPANNCQFTGCNEDLTACLTPQNRCVRGGCQGELCVPLGDTTQTICIHDPKNMCYASATCEWTGSACAWRQTPELQECLTDNAGGTCPTDQSCLSRSACADQGGTSGNACGAADTNVCCGGIGPDDPVEECDDGNRVDDDACGNDCRINCKSNADCPEGACVDGQCVDQCAAPVPGGQHAAAPSQKQASATFDAFLSKLMAQQVPGNFTLLP